MGTPAVQHMMIHQDTLAQEYNERLNGETLFPGLIQQWAFGGLRMTENRRLRVAGLTPPADGSECTVSLWCRFPDGLSTNPYLFNSGDGSTSANYVIRNYFADSSNAVIANCATAAAAAIGYQAPTDDDLEDGEWHHIAFCRKFDGSTPSYIYVDGVQRDSDVFAAANIGYSNASVIQIGGYHTWGLTSKAYTLDIADVWFDRTYRDLSDSAVLEKFIQGGEAVNLGDGDVFGSTPALFLDTSAPDAGLFTERGSITGLVEYGSAGAISAVT